MKKITLDWQTVNEKVWRAKRNYTDLKDVKGRTPGHIFIIRYGITVTEQGLEVKKYFARSEMIRAEESFGASQYPSGSFDTLEEAIEHLEIKAVRLEAAARKNKAFQVVGR